LTLTGDPLNSNLILHLLTVPGDNSGSTWHDLKGTHHATLPSGTAFGADQRPGGLCGAVRMDGTNFPTIAQSSAFAVSSFTVAMWVKLSDVTGGYDLLNFRTSKGGLWYYGPTPLLGWAVNGSTQGIYLPWTPQADRWYHVAYTRSGSTHRLYVDGVELGSATQATAQSAPTNGLSLNFPGRVDDVRIWSVALTGADIAKVYRDSLARHCGTLSFSGWGPSPVAVGFLGDSLTAGYLLNEKPGDLAAALLQSTPALVPTVSPGVSGATTADYLPGQLHMINAKALFERHGVHHVSVCLGTNDCSDANAVTPAQYRENMLAICRDLVADGYTVLLNYPPAFVPPAYTVFTATSLARLESYQPVIDSLVNGVTILQGDTTAFDDFGANPAWIASDNIHLTPTGNAALAQRWAGVVEAL
jgi:lysophospholipase L1-like esterase